MTKDNGIENMYKTKTLNNHMENGTKKAASVSC